MQYLEIRDAATDVKPARFLYEFDPIRLEQHSKNIQTHPDLEWLVVLHWHVIPCPNLKLLLQNCQKSVQPIIFGAVTIVADVLLHHKKDNSDILYSNHV
jgi:hypothetical protein